MTQTVEIGGRVFRVGAWYGSKPGHSGRGVPKKRQFLGIEVNRRGTWARFIGANGHENRVYAVSFVAQAGEELPDA